MKILADENIARQIVLRLRVEGHDVSFIMEMARSSDDDVVLQLANLSEAVLVTDDKDFGELVYRRQLPTVGVVLLRLAALSNDEKAELAVRVFREHAAELPGAFTVVSPRAATCGEGA